MNEEHVIAAILAAGVMSQNKGASLTPEDAVKLYDSCLIELLELVRAPRTPATE